MGAYMELTYKPLPNLGIEIKNLTSYDLDQPPVINELLSQYNQHHLLILKDQHLNEDALIKVANLFGEPTPSLVKTFQLVNYPLITKHSNIKNEDKKPTGIIAPEYVFHSDSYFTTNPNKSTLLYSLKSPDYGGETFFVNSCHAYDTLDISIKNLIEDKKAIYKNAYVNQPPVSHPLMRHHPVTKRKALFVNIHRALGVDGIEQTEALALLNFLYEHATNKDYVYKHKWSDGDLLIWNNVTTMHCATEIDTSQARLLYRILIKGDLPVT